MSNEFYLLIILMAFWLIVAIILLIACIKLSRSIIKDYKEIEQIQRGDFSELSDVYLGENGFEYMQYSDTK